MAGGDGVEAQRQRASRQRRELDSLVAPHARIRGLAAFVGRHEVVDHVFFEAVGEIPDVERDVEHVGDAPGVTGVLLRAAAPRSGAQRARRGRQRQVHADDVVTRVDHPRGGDRRVDAAAHRDEHPHCFGRSRAGQRGLARPLDRRGQHRQRGIDVGLGAGVAQRQPQRAARAGRVGAHREQHMRRLGDTGGARRARRALDALGVQQHQQRIAFAAAEREVGVAGQARITGGAVEVHVIDRRQHAVDQPVAQRLHAGAVGRQALDRHLRGGGHRHSPGDIRCAGTDVAFLAAAVQQRHTAGVAPQQQRADARRTTELVGGDAHRRQSAGREVDRNLADGLDRVAVHRHIEFRCNGG